MFTHHTWIFYESCQMLCHWNKNKTYSWVCVKLDYWKWKGKGSTPSQGVGVFWSFVVVFIAQNPRGWFLDVGNQCSAVQCSAITAKSTTATWKQLKCHSCHYKYYWVKILLLYLLSPWLSNIVPLGLLMEQSSNKTNLKIYLLLKVYLINKCNFLP